MELEKLREEVASADRDLAEVFVRRMKAVKAIAEYKIEHGLPILDSTQEQHVVENGAALIEDDELKSFYIPFLKNAIETSKSWQRHLMEGQRIAYSGGMDPKDYTVAGDTFPGSTRIAYQNYKLTYQAVVEGDCEVCVMPFEKSLTGEVGQVLDLMYAGDLFVNKVVSVDNGAETVRYAVLSRVDNPSVGAERNGRFLIMFTVKDETGGLAKAINILSSYGYNMRILRSRPMKDLPWNYYFYAEAEGDDKSENGVQMLNAMRVVCPMVKVLGRYTAE